MLNTSSSASSAIMAYMHSIAINFAPSPVFASPSFSHFVTIKLTCGNHLLWKAQIIPYLRSQQLLGYADGSIEAPSRFIDETTEGEIRQGQNPAYLAWFQQDQLMLSSLLSLLTEEILGQVLFPHHQLCGVL